MSLRLSVAALLGVTAAFPASVRAGSPAEAEALIQKGIELRRAGRDFEALRFFQEAQAMVATPRSNAQLGLAEQALGHWAEAEEHLGSALEATGDPWIRQNRKVLSESLRTVRGHIGQVELRGSPDGADIKVNGRPRGMLPLAGPLRVGEGYVEIEILAAGHIAARRRLMVTPGHTQPLFVTLDKTEPDPPGGPAVSERALAPRMRVEATPSPPQADAPPPAPAADHGGALRTAGIVLGVVGVAGIVGGIWMTTRVGSLQRQVEQGGLDPADDMRLREDGRLAETLQWVGYGVGGAALVGGGLLYYFGHRRSSDARSAVRPSVAVMPLPRGWLASLRWRM